MEIDNIKTEQDLLDSEESHLISPKNETVQYSNIMEDYLSIKEEPLQQVSPEQLLSKINSAIVYTTRLDDMPFLMQSKQLDSFGLKKCLAKIESDSKPRLKPGTAVTRKRKLSLNTYNVMKRKIYELTLNKRLLKSCNMVNVVVEKLPLNERNIPIIVIKDENGQFETESNDKISSEDIIEVSDSDDDMPLKNNNSSSPKNIPQSKITKPIKLPISIDTENPQTFCTASSFYFHDSYFNRTVVCGVDEIGIIKVYFEYQGKRNVEADENHDIHPSLFTFTRCCWYSVNEKIDKIWQYQMKKYHFLCKPHTCTLNTCQCCCRKKMIPPTNNYVKLTNREKQLTFTKLYLDLRQRVTALIHMKFLVPKKINEFSANYEFKELIDFQTPFIHIKNIETRQSEFYYLTKNRNVGGYYVKSYNFKMPIISQLTNFTLSSTYHDLNFIVCCWAKREQEVSISLKKKLVCINPAILRYIKRFHSCDPQNCKCCCKQTLKEDIKKTKLALKPLDLPKIRKHTVQNRPIYSGNRKISLLANKAKVIEQDKSKDITKDDDEKTPHEGLNKVQTNDNITPNVSINPSVDAITSSSKKRAINKVQTHRTATPHTPIISNAIIPSSKKRARKKSLPLEVRQLEKKTTSSTVDTQCLAETKPIRSLDAAQSNKTINQGSDIFIPRELPNSMTNIILTVDDNRKVAAALPAPVTSYSADELLMLTEVLKKAQEQIIKFGLLPGTKFNITKPMPVPTLNLSTIPFIISQNNKSELQNNYKEFTNTAVLKMQHYKKYFYFAKNLQTLKLKESDVLNKESVSTTNKPLGVLGEKNSKNVAGPSGMPFAFPSTSKGLSNVYQNLRMYSEGMAELTPLSQTDAAESSDDDKIDDEYDIEDSDALADIKPVIIDPIAIEEHSTASDGGSECILGT